MTCSAAPCAELTLTFENGRWCARGSGIDVAHPELRELDARILEKLEGPAARAVVRFDTGRLPVWLRQYQAHYFNYVLTRPGDEGEA